MEDSSRTHQVGPQSAERPTPPGPYSWLHGFNLPSQSFPPRPSASSLSRWRSSRVRWGKGYRNPKRGPGGPNVPKTLVGSLHTCHFQPPSSRLPRAPGGPGPICLPQDGIAKLSGREVPSLSSFFLDVCFYCPDPLPGGDWLESLLPAVCKLCMAQLQGAPFPCGHWRFV